MAGKSKTSLEWGKIRNPRGLVSRSVIRRLAQHLAERFQPDRIILFGSYAQWPSHSGERCGPVSGNEGAQRN